nr:hypothetical protein Iba_chr02bCG5400 [Ipomoea batatas]GME08385.1 hypothetical protein Iba_scaffold7539CG0030 [Ipomoea batatas]
MPNPELAFDEWDHRIPKTFHSKLQSKLLACMVYWGRIYHSRNHCMCLPQDLGHLLLCT